MMESGAPILDWIASATARDEGLLRVRENNQEWHALALIEIERLSTNHEGWANLENGFTGEDIRAILTPRIGHPSSPNAWGSVIRTAIKRELIVATGRYVPMRDVSSHARKTALYVWVSQTTELHTRAGQQHDS